MRVVTVDAPGRENAFGETVFAGATNVIHDLLTTVFDDGFANACGDRVECFVPSGLLPLAGASFAGAFEWMKNAIGIGYLVERRRTFGAVATARTGVFGVTFKLLNLAGDLVDVSKQAAGRLAIEAGSGDERVVPFDTFGPRARIEFCPIVPTFLRRKSGQMNAAGALIEGLALFLVRHLG